MKLLNNSLFEFKNKTIYKNSNFLNSQNYIKDGRNYFYLKYLLNRNSFEPFFFFILPVVFSLSTLIFVLKYLLNHNILSYYSINGFLLILVLIIFIIFSVFYLSRKIISILLLFFYYIVLHKSLIYYNSPISKLGKGEYLFKSDFYVRKK